MIIGLTGYKSSGKSLCANYLCEKYNAHELAFADPLKKICSELYNVPLDNFYDAKLKEVKIDELNTTPRQLMQIIGMKIREVGDDIPDILVKNPWIFKVKNEIIKLNKMHKGRIPIVISDVRFKDEFDMIKSLNGIIVRITRPTKDIPSIDNHISETSMRSLVPDCLLCNISSISEFKNEIDKLMKEKILQHKIY